MMRDYGNYYPPLWEPDNISINMFREAAQLDEMTGGNTTSLADIDDLIERCNTFGQFKRAEEITLWRDNLYYHIDREFAHEPTNTQAF